MASFHAIDKLLSTLPFSILGYKQHETALDQFFSRLCDSELVNTRHNIEIVSYSYASLVEGDERLACWDTKNFSNSFFFHALNEKYSLILLNAYYDLRNNLFGHTDHCFDQPAKKHLTNNVAISLSRLLIRDVGFRLRFSSKDDWHFSYLEQNNVFSIVLPLTRIINRTEGDERTHPEIFQGAVRELLSSSTASMKDIRLAQLPVQRVETTRSKYIKKDILSSPIKNNLDSFRKVFRQRELLEELRNELIEAILFWHRSNQGYFYADDGPEHLRKNILNWVELFFQIVFVSFVYDAWIEYFPSVCGVQESGRRSYYRNLGGLIIGYRISEPITQEERGVFRTVSARVSSVVSAKWMNDSFQHLRRERNREQLVRALESLTFLGNEYEEITHGKKPVVDDDDFDRLFREKFEKNKTLLTTCFLDSYMNLRRKNNGHISKYCLTTLSNGETPGSKVRVTNPLFACKNRGNKGTSDIEFKRFNVPLIKSVIEELISKHRTHDKKPHVAKSFNCNEWDCCFIVSYEGENSFNVGHFVNSLKEAEKEAKGSLVGTYFCNYFEAIDCHGVLSIEYWNSEIADWTQFFSTRRSIFGVLPDKIILNSDYNFKTPNDGQAKKIRVLFRSEL
jgi:hypothetical protein